MSIHRTAVKRDGNEDDIVLCLEAAGATVTRISIKNVPDLLVGFRGRNYLLEVKMPKGKLSEGQQIFIDDWQGYVAIVRSIDDALRAIGAID